MTATLADTYSAAVRALVEPLGCTVVIDPWLCTHGIYTPAVDTVTEAHATITHIAELLGGALGDHLDYRAPLGGTRLSALVDDHRFEPMPINVEAYAHEPYPPPPPPTPDATDWTWEPKDLTDVHPETPAPPGHHWVIRGTGKKQRRALVHTHTYNGPPPTDIYHMVNGGQLSDMLPDVLAPDAPRYSAFGEYFLTRKAGTFTPHTHPTWSTP